MPAAPRLAPLFPDQKRAVDLCVTHEAAAVFGKPGTGKTRIFGTALNQLRADGEAKNALVVTRHRLIHTTWQEQNALWRMGFDIGVLHGSRKDDVWASSKHDMFVINPEGLAWWAGRPRRRDVDTLIVDESTLFKNYTAGRFKLMQKRIGDFKNRYIGTGTPRPRSIQNLWSQVWLLDGGKRLGRTISEFRRRYMFDAAPRHVQYPDWQPVPGAEAEVYKAIADISITIERRWTNKPVISPIVVDLPTAARRVYDDMERLLFADIDSGRLNASNAGDRSSKLHQLVGGWVYGDTKADVHRVHTAKLDALAEELEAMDGEPLLVACYFIHEAAELQAALKKLGYGAVPYFGGGGVKPKDTLAVVEAWNRKEVPVLLANPASAAWGLNLQTGGSTVMWYTLTYDWELYDQFNSRVDRQGQKNEVIIRPLIARNTIDEVMVEVLQSRDADDNDFYLKLKEYRNGRKKR